MSLTVFFPINECFQAEANPQEKLKMLRALTCIRVPWILSHFLELAKDESVVRSQDYFSFLTFLSWNRVGQPLVWDFVRTEWNYLVGRFTLNDRLFGRFLATATDSFATELRLKEMKDFFEANPHHCICKLLYDDACHLKPYCQNPKILSYSNATKFLSTLDIKIDRLHVKNHKSEKCKTMNRATSAKDTKTH